jgi:hypothetical protein
MVKELAAEHDNAVLIGVMLGLLFSKLPLLAQGLLSRTMWFLALGLTLQQLHSFFYFCLLGWHCSSGLDHGTFCWHSSCPQTL